MVQTRKGWWVLTLFSYALEPTRMERKPCKACGQNQNWTSNILYERFPVCSRECYQDLMLKDIAGTLKAIFQKL